MSCGVRVMSKLMFWKGAVGGSGILQWEEAVADIFEAGAFHKEVSSGAISSTWALL